MSNIWHDIAARRIKPEDFICVIEISKGSKKNTNSTKKRGLSFSTEFYTLPRTIPQITDLSRELTATTETLWTYFSSARRHWNRSRFAERTLSARFR